jgi:hypothetical protein
MPSPGDVLHYENFVFDNGKVKNKFFIVLHDDPCLMIITTTQSLRYPMVDDLGCNPDKMTFFFPAGQQNVFTASTYLVMQKIYELPKTEVKSLIAVRRVRKKILLPAKIFNAIKDCLRHFRDDIADEHWDMIFKPNAPSAASFQALAEKFKRK